MSERLFSGESASRRLMMNRDSRMLGKLERYQNQTGGGDGDIHVEQVKYNGYCRCRERRTLQFCVRANFIRVAYIRTLTTMLRMSKSRMRLNKDVSLWVTESASDNLQKYYATFRYMIPLVVYTATEAMDVPSRRMIALRVGFIPSENARST